MTFYDKSSGKERHGNANMSKTAGNQNPGKGRHSNANMSKTAGNQKLTQWNCDVCGLNCHSRARLKYHMIIHTGEKPFKCDVCGKCFNRKGNLKAHSMTHVKHLV